MTIALLGLLIFAAGVSVGFSIGRWRQNKHEPDRLKELRLTEFSRLQREAREAHYRGETGIADILDDAASRVLESGKKKG